MINLGLRQGPETFPVNTMAHDALSAAVQTKG